MAHGLLGAGRVEQVLQHAAVDVAVLGLGRATLPGREEDVRRRGAAHGRGDRVGVLEVGGERRDPLVETVGATAQARDLPAVGQQALREVAAADARDADDERARRSSRSRRIVAGAPARRRTPRASRIRSAPAATTQIARTVSVPVVAQPVRRRRREGDRVAGLEDELVEPDDDAQRAAEDVARTRGRCDARTRRRGSTHRRARRSPR